MRLGQIRVLSLIACIWFMASCANIVPPTGGEKDTTPPKLLQISPADSQLNTRVTKLEMRFDEFIVLENPGAEIQVSPILPFPLTATLKKRTVTVLIPDSLLDDNITYRVSFGNAIKDLHEGNPFTGYSYMFSTGNYFDSLSVSGSVSFAATGKTADDVWIMLYDADDSDTAVVRKKPKYITKASGGSFIIPGLPARRFRIYALKDANENLIYDGGEEEIAFINKIIVPYDSTNGLINLRLFQEEADPINSTDSSTNTSLGKRNSGNSRGKRDKEQVFAYRVAVDTANVNDRTYDITKPLKVTSSDTFTALNKERIFLSYDSADITVESDFSIIKDSADQLSLNINSNWKENTVYTLRLLKGFVTDTAGNDAMPSKYIFRTKSDDDYAKLFVNIPSKYLDPHYLLMVSKESDTVYKKQITDTVVSIFRLAPAEYSLYIIVDSNQNGKWDTGNLLEKIQPEVVIPYNGTIPLKKGWENSIDFLMPVTEEKSATAPKKSTTKSQPKR